MKNYTLYFVLLVTTAIGCKKTDEDHSSISKSAPGFHENKGIRPLRIIPENYTSDLHELFLTGDVALTPDGILHWCHGKTFSYGQNMLYRESMNLATGDSIYETGTLKGITSKALLDDKIKYVPYSNQLYSLATIASGKLIDGDIQYNFGSDNLSNFHPKADGTLSSAGFSGYYQNGSDVIAQANAYVQLPGASTKTNYTYNHKVPDAPAYEWQRYRLGAFALDPNKHVVGLLVSGDSAVAIDLNSGTVLAAIPYAGIPTSENHFSGLGNYTFSVTSADGSQMAGLYRGQMLAGNPPTITTLVYNFASHALKVGIPGVVPTGLTGEFIYKMDLADDGSIVFPSYDNPTTFSGLKIIRQNGLDQTVLASGFLDNSNYGGSVQYLHTIAGKVFIGLIAPGANPGKASNSNAYVLGVIE